MRQEYSQEILDLCLGMNLARLGVSLRKRQEAYQKTEQDLREEKIREILETCWGRGGVDFLV